MKSHEIEYYRNNVQLFTKCNAKIHCFTFTFGFFWCHWTNDNENVPVLWPFYSVVRRKKTSEIVKVNVQLYRSNFQKTRVFNYFNGNAETISVFCDFKPAQKHTFIKLSQCLVERISSINKLLKYKVVVRFKFHQALKLFLQQIICFNSYATLESLLHCLCLSFYKQPKYTEKSLHVLSCPWFDDMAHWDIRSNTAMTQKLVINMLCNSSIYQILLNLCANMGAFLPVTRHSSSQLNAMTVTNENGTIVKQKQRKQVAAAAAASTFR